MSSNTPMSASIANMLLNLKDGRTEMTDRTSNEKCNRQSFSSTSTESIDKETCHCKKSKCLKLYCQCFAAMSFCSAACRCTQCENSDKFSDSRWSAIQLILERNPTAFDSKFKVTKAPTEEGDEDANVYHKTGCRCRKSMCLKKYCECFQAGVKCNSTCTCLYCCNNNKSTQENSVTVGVVSRHERGYLELSEIAARSTLLVKAAPNLGSMCSQDPNPSKPQTAFETQRTSTLELIIGNEKVAPSVGNVINQSLSKTSVDRDIFGLNEGCDNAVKQIVNPTFSDRAILRESFNTNPDRVGAKRKFLDQVLLEKPTTDKSVKVKHIDNNQSTDTSTWSLPSNYEDVEKSKHSQMASPTSVNIASVLSLLSASH